MILKALEIQGFKSFPDKTVLSFGTGITAVVGPNGSGKSNISDAVRWVLGEQSSKTLRGSKMEDVIFNGTSKRKATGFAEVSLIIDNTRRSLDFDADDVKVTRRYYRSGESEYLLNNATVRLKDIQLLFMDTGLGRDGYSMVGQGKIDAIKEVCDGRTRDNYTCWLIPIDKVAAEATDVATSVEDYTIATVMPDDDCTVRPSEIRGHCMAQASVVQNLPKQDEGSCVVRFFKKLFRKDK